MSHFEDEDPFVSYGRALLKKTIDADKPVKGVPFPAIYSSRGVTALGDSVAPPVGILGGGMAGLYTALILADLKVPFQILEGTDRIGGRCFTHKFEEGGEYDYFVGGLCSVTRLALLIPAYPGRGRHALPSTQR
jgi:NAD(P)-binding Rossmann-like domain